MRLTCPECEAAYEVPDSLIGPGRRVRCVRCSHDWLPAGEAEATAPAPDEAPPAPSSQAPNPEPDAAVEAAETVASADAPAPRRDRALAAAWIGSLLLLLGLLGVVWSYRQEIAAAWPPAQRVLLLLEPARG